MQGLYAAKKVVVVMVFFFTMLLMKEVMDSLLPAPGQLAERRPLHQPPRHVKPGAILDVEAIAEEEDMGPDVMDQEKMQREVDDMEGDDAGGQDAAGENMAGQDQEEQGGIGKGKSRKTQDEPVAGRTGDKVWVATGKVSDVSAASIFVDDEKVLEDPRQVDEDERQEAGQQGVPAPHLGQGAQLKVANAQTSQPAATAPDKPTFGANYYTVFTSKASKLEAVQIIPSGTLFKVRMKACSDAYLIYKQKAVADEFSYHIGFGYGRKTVIWKQPPDPVTKEHDTPESGFLSCDQFVAYWVKHVGATFEIGLSDQDAFVHWKDPKPFAVGAISVATPHPKQTVVWHLDINTSK